MISNQCIHGFLRAQQTKKPRVPLELAKAIWRGDNYDTAFGQVIYSRAQKLIRIVDVFQHFRNDDYVKVALA